MAMFELLPRPAGAQLVAADLLGLANELSDGFTRLGSHRLRFFGWRRRSGELFRGSVLELHGASQAGLAFLLFALFTLDISLRAQLHAREHRDGVVLDAI